MSPNVVGRALFEVGVVTDALSVRWEAMLCWCAHPRSAHRHFRAGSDCSGCGCSAFGWERLQDAR